MRNLLLMKIPLFYDVNIRIISRCKYHRKILYEDLKKVNGWTFQWKMSFNSDLGNQADEFVFSHKSKKLNHPLLAFNNINIFQIFSQKHVDAKLDFKLTFDDGLTNKLAKLNKTIGLLHKLSSTIIAKYKAFVQWLHLCWGPIESSF